MGTHPQLEERLLSPINLHDPMTVVTHPLTNRFSCAHDSMETTTSSRIPKHPNGGRTCVAKNTSECSVLLDLCEFFWIS